MRQRTVANHNSNVLTKFGAAEGCEAGDAPLYEERPDASN